MERWRRGKRNNCDGEERKERKRRRRKGRSRRWPVSAKDFGAAKWLRFRSPRQPSDHLVLLVCPLALRLAPVPSYRPSCWSSMVLRCQWGSCYYSAPRFNSSKQLHSLPRCYGICSILLF
ncbi:hypothetical protein ASPBRDRAFT_536203 [Aspergillus brasiliensis CBS 101740]|uniref:Uncharacterized protein n=1 Tax=Aspergillus brasiliensis (strain CBS 101740 / IMI 381727 / IBT 21946) TaxID=767769 RepID=A0A1L9UL57_ASPBC|nr:hypothetical protein ASPBRDRAFT_536203 [Aspergillus brasiliensis CBS 101740]